MEANQILEYALFLQQMLRATCCSREQARSNINRNFGACQIDNRWDSPARPNLQHWNAFQPFSLSSHLLFAPPVSSQQSGNGSGSPSFEKQVTPIMAKTQAMSWSPEPRNCNSQERRLPRFCDSVLRRQSVADLFFPPTWPGPGPFNTVSLQFEALTLCHSGHQMFSFPNSYMMFSQSSGLLLYCFYI